MARCATIDRISGAVHGLQQFDQVQFNLLVLDVEDPWIALPAEDVDASD
jgi:hypothetical protein